MEKDFHKVSTTNKELKLIEQELMFTFVQVDPYVDL